jgi:hypothetical protein
MSRGDVKLHHHPMQKDLEDNTRIMHIYLVLKLAEAAMVTWKPP